MIKISTTVESMEQAQSLVQKDIDVLYFGEEEFGLRLPHNFTREQMKELVKLCHENGKKARVAVNAIMHPDKMTRIKEYLAFLEDIRVDDIVVGDPGVIYVLKKESFNLPYIYDAATMVTSSRQINFWAKKGAEGAVLAREIPFLELKTLSEQVVVPAEIQVYGATCIHHSKRPLVTNYFNFTKQEKRLSKEEGLFISEPKEEETHYSIFEDAHGTHIYETDDIDLTLELQELKDIGLTHWKLDGMYTKGEAFLKIVDCFVEAKQSIDSGQFSQEQAKILHETVQANHPENRTLTTGFYYLDPDEIR